MVIFNSYVKLPEGNKGLNQRTFLNISHTLLIITVGWLMLHIYIFLLLVDWWFKILKWEAWKTSSRGWINCKIVFNPMMDRTGVYPWLVQWKLWSSMTNPSGIRSSARAVLWCYPLVNKHATVCYWKWWFSSWIYPLIAWWIFPVRYANVYQLLKPWPIAIFKWPIEIVD